MKWCLIVLSTAVGVIGCAGTKDRTVTEARPLPPVSEDAPVEPVPYLVLADLEAAIRRHIDRETSAGGGYFHVPYEGSTLRLKLVRVHTEYLATVGEDLHFACVDLATEDGNVYDVDFFMRGSSADAVVTETSVHKLNGKPYYVWAQGEDERWERRPPDQASNALLGVLTGVDRFEFTYQAQLPTIAGSARMWLPLAQSDAFQTVRVDRIVAPGRSRVVTDAVHGNQVLVIDLDEGDGGRTVEVGYIVERREKSAYADSRANAARFLNAERLVPDHEQFRAIAEPLTRGKANDLEKARALYDHTMEAIKYMKYGSGWGQGDAMYACDAQSGNCTDFHAYFIALCRSVEIPARFAIGASIPSERDAGGMDGYHCWAEFYAASDTGSDGRWWPVDISEADKYTTLAGYYFGHHPANRFEFSRGRDLVVDPLPSSGPINFLAYPILEMGGEPVKVKTTFGYRRLASVE